MATDGGMVGNGFQPVIYAVQIPVSSPLAVGQVEQQVNYLRSLVAALRGAARRGR